MRAVDPNTLPRQPKLTGDYGADLASLKAALSPETWTTMHLPDPGPPRLMRLRERARARVANEEAVLLWNGLVKTAERKWTTRWRIADTVLIDFFDTETVAVARFMFLHRDGFRAHIRLTGETAA